MTQNVQKTALLDKVPVKVSLVKVFFRSLLGDKWYDKQVKLSLGSQNRNLLEIFVCWKDVIYKSTGMCRRESHAIPCLHLKLS